MRSITNKFILSLVMLAFIASSCENFFDINKDPDNILEGPLSNQLTSLTASLGYWAGSDVHRNASILAQQFAGQSTGPETQTQQYEKYLISGNDFNNAFATLYATILNDAENIITKATASGSPHYAGVAKILKAYAFQVSVDAWGDLPYDEAQKLTGNLHPAYEDDAQIYTKLIALLDEAIQDVNAPVSIESPGGNSTIYQGSFTTTRTNWVKLANTLKLRLLIHYSEVDQAFATAQINNLINAPSTQFFSSNADNFQMRFANAANSRNPIDQFETGRAGYLVSNNTLVSLMNSKNDPRRSLYFTRYQGNFVGSVGGAPSSQNYSKFHSYLRGEYDVNSKTYKGDAPIRMLTFAEYNFLRAEAALRFGSPGNAQDFFQAGIKASLDDAKNYFYIPSDTVGYNTLSKAYLAANQTLTGLAQLIEEKYVANYGVLLEPWTDWRRTGFPAAIAPPANAVVPFVPRSWYYPQSEVDFNNSLAAQKSGMDVRVFWDTRP